MTNETNTAEELLAQFEDTIKRYEDYLSITTITRCGFVIELEGVYVNPEIKGNKTIPGKVQWKGNPLDVIRFTKEDAETIAATVKNRNGTVGKAIGINKAVHNELEKCKNSLAFWSNPAECFAETATPNNLPFAT